MSKVTLQWLRGYKDPEVDFSVLSFDRPCWGEITDSTEFDLVLPEQLLIEEAVASMSNRSTCGLMTIICDQNPITSFKQQIQEVYVPVVRFSDEVFAHWEDQVTRFNALPYSQRQLAIYYDSLGRFMIRSENTEGGKFPLLTAKNYSGSAIGGYLLKYSNQGQSITSNTAQNSLSQIPIAYYAAVNKVLALETANRTLLWVSAPTGNVDYPHSSAISLICEIAATNVPKTDSASVYGPLFTYLSMGDYAQNVSARADGERITTLENQVGSILPNFQTDFVKR